MMVVVMNARHCSLSFLSDKEITLHLESELLEKPTVLARLISLLQFSFDLSSSLSSQGRVTESILVYQRLVQIDINGITCRHEMVVVEDLEKRLYLGPDLDLLLAHLLSHGSRMTVYTSNKSVTVRLLCRTVVIVLDNDGLPAGVSTAQHQHDFTGLSWT